MSAPDFTSLWSRALGRFINLRGLVNAYHGVAPEVLADLAKFCGALERAPLNGDPFVQGRTAGRRDVWLHILAHRNLREEEVFALLKGEPIANAKERYRAGMV